MIRLSVFLIALFFVASSLDAQRPLPETDDEYEKIYQRRIQKEMLYGVYIPKDLGDAFGQLNRLIDKETQAKFKSLPEGIAAQKLHFSFGRWMMHNWGFYGGSRLSHYLRGIGLSYPDDMAYFLIVTYHRNLNRNKLAVKELLASIQEKRAAKEKDRKLQGEVIFEEKRIRPKEEN